MFRKQCVVWFSVGLLTFAALFAFQAAWGHETKLKPSDSKAAKAARLTLEHTVAAYEAGRATAEDVYQWSRRLMKAEIRSGAGKAAVADHVDRTLKLHKLITARHEMGVEGGEPRLVHAAKYYLERARIEGSL